MTRDVGTPAMGVFDTLLAGEITDSVERFRLWILSHDWEFRARLWRRFVFERCLPDPSTIEFVADGGRF